jgi:hypothetical protein
MPALQAVTQKILNQGDKTRIQINSQLPLPAAIVLGFCFNIRVARVGVWARKPGVSDFKQQFWLSDGDSADVTYTPKWVKPPHNKSRSAIVELVTHGDIHDDVETFATESNLTVDAWLQVHLVDKKGQTLPNIDEGHAVAYANQVGRILRQLKADGVKDFHLFACMPSALGIFVGQRLQACGRIHLYWFDNPTYRFAFTLK